MTAPHHTITSSAVPDKPEKVVCIYCGSAAGNSPKYVEAARELGKALAKNGVGIVYGGGDGGIMGAVAGSAVENNGYVHGIIPSALFERERNADIMDGKYGHTTVVKDMHTRKKLMSDEAFAFVSLPGGYGTYDETLEAVSWTQLGVHTKPVIVFNMNGFYDGLKILVETAVKEGFIKKEQQALLVFVNTSEELLEAIENSEVPKGATYKLNWEK